MSRETAKHHSLNSFYIMLFSLMLITGSGALLAAEGEEQRSSVSKHHVTGGRENPGNVTESEEAYDALVTTGERTRSSTRGSSPKGDGVAQKGDVGPLVLRGRRHPVQGR